MGRRCHFFIALAAGFTLMAGCASLESGANRRQVYVDEHPELSDQMAESILNQRIQVGMTQEMVQASWGKPARVEATKKEGAEILWIYGNVFVGGTITNLFFDEEAKLIRYEVQDQQTHANSGSLGSPTEKLAPTSATDGTLSKGPGAPSTEP